MRLNKKSSLSLSINAIVILVLAIAMLGLGLGFTKSMFDYMKSRGFFTIERCLQRVVSFHLSKTLGNRPAECPLSANKRHSRSRSWIATVKFTDTSR